VDNTLDYLDQASFLAFRADGHPPLIQLTWIYRAEVDLDALRRFQRNLGKGLLGRRVERSPLPFGRHRWVAWSGPAEIDVADDARSLSEVTAWTDEQAAVPIDPECGPPWRLSVQPLVEGGAAVTLLVAHTVIDGGGLLSAVADAVGGVTKDLGYPEAHSRTKTEAALQDSYQVLRDLPMVAGSLLKLPLAAKNAGRFLRASSTPRKIRRGRGNGAGRSLALRGSHTDLGRKVTIPSVTVLVDDRQWNQKAESLGGTSNSLFIGFAARLCGRLGYVGSDGLAIMSIPVNMRTPGDTRGNALTGVPLSVDPSAVTTDLRGVRDGLKTVLSTLDESGNHLQGPLPLTPFVPRFVAHRAELSVLRSHTVNCSNLGDVDPAVNRPDGTDSDRLSVRVVRWADRVTQGFLRRTDGHVTSVVSGRLGGRLFITLGYANAEGSNTVNQLIETARGALDDFGLTGTVE